MAELNFVFEEDLVAEAEASQGGSFGILDSGVYNVTINFASLDKTKGGNNTLSLDITTDTGHQTTLWSVFKTIDKTWSSGKENPNYKDFMAFAGAVGMKSMTPVPYDLKKENGELIKKLSVVKELQGAKCVLAIQKELDVYNGKVRERNIIHSSYNVKGQTNLEALNNGKAEKVEKVKARLSDRLTNEYKAHQAFGSTATEEPQSLGSLL